MLCQRIRGLGLAHTTPTRLYSGDQSGSKEYRFNKFGFRGEDLRAEAKRTLIAAGCSITFGVDLNEGEIWIHRFKERYAKHYGYQADDLNLLNLGETGASNDSIVRTVLPQCQAVKPHLLLVQFTYMNRIEYLTVRALERTPRRF
jgi:hypothetical protein